VTGPDARIVSGLDDLKIEMMQLNLYLRDLLAVQGRELPAPVVNVSPTPVVVERVDAPPAVLTPESLAQALSGALSPRPDANLQAGLESVKQAVEDLGVSMRAIAGSAAYGPSGGGTVYLSDTQLAQLTSALGERSFTERMLAKAPATGFALWLDTADATYIYIAEAPSDAVAADAEFRGVRVVKDANGSPLGKIEVAEDFAWSTRSSASWS
jgi:hypothetical protein